MSIPLPYLRNTSSGLQAQCLYPFTRTVRFTTTVTTFQNGSEQRWSIHPPLQEFNLPMTNLNSTDKAQWLSIFSGTFLGMKEAGGADVALTLGSTTYHNLVLTSDDLPVTNTRAILFDQNITLRQVQNGSYTAPTAGTTYPTLSFGAVAEMPFTQSSGFLTSINENPTGPRFSYGWYGTGLSGFPTSYLRAWTINYPLINDADLATLEGFFLTQQGRFASFSFTDPLDNTAYTHVRFGEDTLSVHYITKNQNSTRITLVQTNGS